MTKILPSDKGKKNKNQIWMRVVLWCQKQTDKVIDDQYHKSVLKKKISVNDFSTTFLNSAIIQRVPHSAIVT